MHMISFYAWLCAVDVQPAGLIAAAGPLALYGSGIRLAAAESSVSAAIDPVLICINQPAFPGNILNSRNKNIDKKLFINI